MTLPELIPIDVLFADPDRAGGALTPDGSRVVFLAPDEGVQNIWVMTLGKDDAAPITKDRGRGIQGFGVAARQPTRAVRAGCRRG